MDSITTAARWPSRDRIWFRCTQCKEVHHGLPEISFELPEPIAVLGRSARKRRALVDGDVAILDGTRYFLRATLAASVHGFAHEVTWGVWVEARWGAFKRYWQRLATDGEPVEPFKARLASTLAGFGATRGLVGTICETDDGLRPRFQIEPTVKAARHPLLAAQQNGVTAEFALEQARKVGVLVLVS